MLNILPVNILPINIFPNDIGQIIQKTLDCLIELKSHLAKECSCITKIYEYIEQEDIPVRLKYLNHANDKLILDAMVKLNKILVKTYVEIKKYKEGIHIKCIDYVKLIGAIDKRLHVLNLRIDLYKFNHMKV